MTSYFGITHGQAVSISLGEFLEFNYYVTDKDLNGQKDITAVKKNMEDLIRCLVVRK